jgi:hypothetical protein
MQVPSICPDNIDVIVAGDCRIERYPSAIRGPSTDEKSRSAERRDLLKSACVASSDPNLRPS